MDVNTHYMKLILQKIAIFFIVFSAIHCGLIGCCKINLVERMFGKTLGRCLYILMGLSALVVAFNRDTYLPFLGESVFPVSVLQNQVPSGATRTVQVRGTPNTKIVYWASEPTDGSIKTAEDAYKSYKNAGVTTTDNKGFAELKVREPQDYTIPFGHLEPHIHFRECSFSGFLGRIKTVYIKSGYVEGFTI
jgi:uncharacterized membrane protein YuzA (DUF378 family)